MPGGAIVKAKDGIGRLGPRNSVLDNSGNVIGWLVAPGSVFDYAGRLRGMALSSGDFVSLGGNVNGVIRQNQAFDSAGNVIGSVLRPVLAMDLNNTSRGVPNITGYTVDGQQLVTPYGYVLTQNGDIARLFRFPCSRFILCSAIRSVVRSWTAVSEERPERC